jgi:hypothetical protein
MGGGKHGFAASCATPIPTCFHSYKSRPREPGGEVTRLNVCLPAGSQDCKVALHLSRSFFLLPSVRTAHPTSAATFPSANSDR